ncbi:MAG: 4-hydroxy-3-methylbut-2-enyl diphosphate reductase [Bacteroidales bacterium]
MSTKDLHVEIDPAAGFCYGVAGAVRKAEETLQKTGSLYCVGQLVHNTYEVRRLENMGLRTIGREDLPDMAGKSVLFRAHGEPPGSYDMSGFSGARLVDATCPVVKKLQQRVKQCYEKGEAIIIYGKPGHPEVEGILGQVDGKALVAQSPEDLLPDQLPARVTLFSQTTMSQEGLYSLAGWLENQGKKVKLHDTVCRRVSNRVEEIERFARTKDVILFVGGKHSSNSSQLFDIARRINSRSYFVESPDEVEPGWFRPGDRVGVTGGTSTPRWLLEKTAGKVGR